MNNTRDDRRYNSNAVFPQLIANIFFFIIEILLISLFLIVINKVLRIFRDTWITIAIILVFLVAETIRRIPTVSLIIHSSFIGLFAFIRKLVRKVSLYFKTRNAILAVYIFVNLVFIAWIVSKILVGLRSPLSPMENRYSGFMNNSITLSTLTFAIFFAVIVATIQNVSKDFSGEFLKIVINDSIFKSGVLIILLLNFGFISILRFGANEYLLSAVFIATCFIITDFILLLWLTVHYLQIPNIIKMTIIKTERFIKRNVQKAPPPQDGTVLLAKITGKQRFQIWIARWILGSIKTNRMYELGVAKREVDKEIIQKIESRLRPVGGALLTAIARDREEVVTACLQGFEDAIGCYIVARKNYIGGIDQFNLFVLSQYEAALKYIISSPNQHYTEEISRSAANIGTMLLDLKSITVWGESNDHIGVWTGYLIKVAANTYKLEHTEAPPAAADEIARIARRLISKKMFNTAVYRANRDLEILGTLLARSNHFYGSIVAGRCIAGMMNQLYALFYLGSVGEFHDQIYIDSIADSIAKIVSTSIDAKPEPNNYDAIVSPLVSVVWTALLSPNIPQLIGTVLNLKFKNEIAENETTRFLDSTFKKLGWIARYTFQTKTIQAGWMTAQSFSEATFHILRYYSDSQSSEQHMRDAIIKLMKEVVSSLSDAISFAFGSNDIDSQLDHFSAIPALIIYFANKYNLQELIEIYRIPIERLIQIFNSIKVEKDHYGDKRRKLRKYLQLYGAWLHLCFPSSELSRVITGFLQDNRINESTGKGITAQIIPETQRLGYPQGHLLSDEWHLYPSEHWQTIQYEVNKLIGNLENYRTYSGIVNS